MNYGHGLFVRSCVTRHELGVILLSSAFKMLFRCYFSLAESCLSVSVLNWDQVIAHIFRTIIKWLVSFSILVYLPHFCTCVIIVMTAIVLTVLHWPTLAVIFANTSITGIESTLVFSTSCVNIWDSTKVINTTVKPACPSIWGYCLDKVMASIRRFVRVSYLIETIIMLATRWVSLTTVGRSLITLTLV